MSPHAVLTRAARWFLLACAWAFAGGCGAGELRVGGYDFGYYLSGDARARPVQVFDDGTDTFFQFRPGDPVPAIFVTGGGTANLALPSPEGPYLRVAALHEGFMLQAGSAQARVLHAAAAPQPSLAGAPVTPLVQVVPTSRGAARPGQIMAAVRPPVPGSGDPHALDRNSYATPMKGDAVFWTDRGEQEESELAFARGSAVLSRDAQRHVARAVERAGPAATYTVIGRDDDSDKEGVERARASALRAALVRAGVAGERIRLRTGVRKAGSSENTWLSTLLVDTRAGPPMHLAPARNGVPQGGAVAAAQAPGRWAAAASASPQPSHAAPVVREEMPQGGFTLAATDHTVAGAVRRWARALHYEVVWDAPANFDAAITGDATLDAGSVAQALEQLLRALKDKGYALVATIHSNRVIRFTEAGPTPIPRAPADAPGAPRTAAATLPRPSD